MKQPILGTFSYANAADVYSPIHGTDSSGGSATNDAGMNTKIGAGGTVQNAYIVLSAAPGGTSITFTLIKNNVDTAITITIGAAATSGSDLTHTVSVAAGDRLAWHQTRSGVIGSGSVYSGIEFVGSTAQQCIAGGGSPTSPSTSVQSWTPAMSGRTTTSLWETTLDTLGGSLNPLVGTITTLYVEVTTAPAAGKNYVYSIYVNGSEVTASRVTIADTNTTGFVTGLSIAIAASDAIAISSVPTGTPTGPGSLSWSMTITPTVDGQSAICGNSGTGGGSTAAARFVAAAGYWTQLTTEANRDGVLSFTQPTNLFGLKNLYFEVATAPGGSASWTLADFVNSGAGTLSAVITGAATTANDLTHTDFPTSGQLLAMRLTPASTPGATTAFRYGFLAFTIAAGSGGGGGGGRGGGRGGGGTGGGGNPVPPGQQKDKSIYASTRNRRIRGGY